MSEPARNLSAEIVGPKLSDTASLYMCAAAASATLREDWEAAELGAKMALANDKTLFKAWVLLGVSLAKQKNFRLAAEAFHSALKLRPNDLEAWVALGESFISLLDYKSAAAAFRRAMELDPHARHPAGRRARAITGRTIAKLSRS